jgi:hypothetical protein
MKHGFTIDADCFLIDFVPLGYLYPVNFICPLMRRLGHKKLECIVPNRRHIIRNPEFI